MLARYNADQEKPVTAEEFLLTSQCESFISLYQEATLTQTSLLLAMVIAPGAQNLSGLFGNELHVFTKQIELLCSINNNGSMTTT